jgi:uroporphyrinogen-III decarboxylase
MLSKKENYLRALTRQSPEWVPLASEARIRIESTVADYPREFPDGKLGKDDWGVVWFKGEEGPHPAEQDFIITDIEKWRDQIVFPNLDTYDWSIAINQAKEVDRDQYLVQGVSDYGCFDRPLKLLGVEECLMAFVTNPNDMYELCGAIADFKIAFHRRLYETIRMDMLYYCEDWATQQDLFISPDMWRKIIKPHTKRIYDDLKKMNVFINQHCCGRLDSILGDICEIGADLWNPCQPCNDLKAFKKQYGNRISFEGGIDSQFVLGNPKQGLDDVRDEVKKRNDELALPNGGYLVAPSHYIHYDAAKIEVMEETVRTYGREVYKKR